MFSLARYFVAHPSRRASAVSIAFSNSNFCLNGNECGNRGVARWTRHKILSFRYRMNVQKFKHPLGVPATPRNTFLEWNHAAELYAFGARLGENFDRNLLQQAFIDESYVHLQKQKQEELEIDVSSVEPLMDNNYLAKEGEIFLKNVLTDFLVQEFPKFPSDGVNSVVNYLMSDAVLSEISSNLGTKDLIQSKEYPPTTAEFTKTFKAIVGALVKSSGEEKGRKFVLDFVATHLCGKDINDFWEIQEPWGLLLGIYEQLKLGDLEPRLLRSTGRNTILSSYIIGLYNKDKVLVGEGMGETLDIAQEMAARDALQRIFGTKEPKSPFKFQSSNFEYKLIPHVNLSQFP